MSISPSLTKLHADLSRRVVVNSGDLPWHPSPLAGVERCLLERDGDEVARATSLVRYAPGSRFSAHRHGGGEEFLVLEGVFSDEHGDWGPGSYVRNPVGSAHAPFSEGGCTILVKLRQMDPADQTRVVIDTARSPFAPGLVPGLTVLPLHAFGHEQVALVRWETGTRFPLHAHPGGEEIFVLEGVFEDDQGAYPAGTWLRNPAGSRHTPFSRSGCLIWVKTGHLAEAIPASGGAG
ncbi:MAG: cupin domain-containing protein [Cyanobium sp. CZS 25K]|nr:cupin domain-containing protein [Cyanobium sp. CZS25K]